MSISNQQSSSRTQMNSGGGGLTLNGECGLQRNERGSPLETTHYSTLLQLLLESANQARSIEDQQRLILSCLNTMFTPQLGLDPYLSSGFTNQYIQTSNILRDRIIGMRLEEIEKNQTILKNLLNIQTDTDKSSITTASLPQKLTQRQISIQRYKCKKRNWNKRVAYECRKKVAEDRLRVKGRFISKEDQTNIAKLVQDDHKSVFDQKNNLDLKKIQSRIQLFTKIDSKKISKRIILQKIRHRASLLQRIENRQQIFQIEDLRQ